MSGLGWLDVSRIDFNALLLLEPLHVRCMAARTPDEATGTALKAHPSVKWYLQQVHPPIASYIKNCLALARIDPDQDALRQAEICVLNSMQDWLIYVLDPNIYDRLAFLGWDDASLLGMADFRGKIVLDIGSGTGRLAFTVARGAEVVYAVEPVANLRRYLCKKREELGLMNVFPIDGSTTQIPFPDGFADILMAGHVYGDEPEEEFTEFRRVTRDHGMILLHPGTNATSGDHIHQFLLAKGFKWDAFEEPGDGLKRKYWKTINKSSK